MFVWDGTDRDENDFEAAFAEKVRRQWIVRNDVVKRSMQAYVAAFSLVLFGRKSDELAKPEPLLQGGFTPDDFERHAMCDLAESLGRDIIHINFRSVAPYTPTGLITMIFLEDGKAIPHSRSFATADSDVAGARLYAVEDERDLLCLFVFEVGGKSSRLIGKTPPQDQASLLRVAARVEEAISSGAVGDTRTESLAFFTNPEF